MTRPDPRKDLCGFLDWLGDRVESALAGRDAERVAPHRACELLGLGRGYLSPTACPWRIPDYGARGTMLPLAEWRRWIEQPEAVLRAGWDKIPLAERERLRGAA